MTLTLNPALIPTFDVSDSNENASSQNFFTPLSSMPSLIGNSQFEQVELVEVNQFPVP